MTDSIKLPNDPMADAELQAIEDRINDLEGSAGGGILDWPWHDVAQNQRKLIAECRRLRGVAEQSKDEHNPCLAGGIHSKRACPCKGTCECHPSTDTIQAKSEVTNDQFKSAVRAMVRTEGYGVGAYHHRALLAALQDLGIEVDARL